jgi:hypothetical protein
MLRIQAHYWLVNHDDIQLMQQGRDDGSVDA